MMAKKQTKKQLYDEIHDLQQEVIQARKELLEARDRGLKMLHVFSYVDAHFPRNEALKILNLLELSGMDMFWPKPKEEYGEEEMTNSDDTFAIPMDSSTGNTSAHIRIKSVKINPGTRVDTRVR